MGCNRNGCVRLNDRGVTVAIMVKINQIEKKG